MEQISMLKYTDDVVLLSENTETIKLNTIMLVKPGKEVRLKINID